MASIDCLSDPVYMRNLAQLQALRADLAIEYDCDATCPVSTAIFLRVVAEAALEHLEQGAKTADITPFWRVVAPGDKVSARLPIDQKWLEARRQEELG